jgi:hypothetical protein
MKDFTYQTHQTLLKILNNQDFSFITFSQYLQNQPSKSVRKYLILRHDVEKRYHHALHFAQIQYQLGIKGTYFFRILPKSFNSEIVKQIAELGHEIGYHYDDLTYCKGDYEKAIVRFEKNLEMLRYITLVKTICMDGSPLSKYDNKDLWKKYNYKDYGIIGEPYLDINFDKIFYLTDTGHRWDGWKVSVRDKMRQQDKWVRKGLVFHSTDDIIKAANEDRLPKQVMITIHPQRWNDGGLLWVKELLLQGLKNQVKKVLVNRRSYER